ncbi:MAG: PAS domain-containing protein, partial [Ghiorsea sp.]
MKVNMPITQHEHHMGEKDIIVSKTDLEGRITYVNDAFITMSGFSMDELIGKPQNIVRHPEMPAAAFQDLWNSLAAKESWTGMVKNRCKNGDFYWVQANVAPMIEGGEVVGYLSVRTKPSAENIKKASDLYKAINAGKAKLSETSFFEKLNIIKRMQVWQQIISLVLVTMVMFGAAWLMSVSALNEADDGLAMANNDRMTALAAVRSNAIMQSEQVMLLKILKQQKRAPFAENADKLRDNIIILLKNNATIKGSDLGDGERLAADAFANDVDAYVTQVLQPALRLLQQRDWQGLERLVAEKIVVVDVEKASRTIVILESTLDAVSAEEFEATRDDTDRVNTVSITLIMLAIAIASL